MKTFRVLRKVIKGAIHEEEILSDGLPVNEDEYTDGRVELVVALIAQVYDEYGECKDYTYPVPVNYGTLTEIEDFGAPGVKSPISNYKEVEKVLEQIRQDFPPEEYQNNEW